MSAIHHMPRIPGARQGLPATATKRAHRSRQGPHYPTGVTR
jgi:hypothetical protein